MDKQDASSTEFELVLFGEPTKKDKFGIRRFATRSKTSGEVARLGLQCPCRVVFGHSATQSSQSILLVPESADEVFAKHEAYDAVLSTLFDEWASKDSDVLAIKNRSPPCFTIKDVPQFGFTEAYLALKFAVDPNVMVLGTDGRRGHWRDVVRGATVSNLNLKVEGLWTSEKGLWTSEKGPQVSCGARVTVTSLMLSV